MKLKVINESGNITEVDVSDGSRISILSGSEVDLQDLDITQVLIEDEAVRIVLADGSSFYLEQTQPDDIFEDSDALSRMGITDELGFYLILPVELLGRNAPTSTYFIPYEIQADALIINREALANTYPIFGTGAGEEQNILLALNTNDAPVASDDTVGTDEETVLNETVLICMLD